MTGQFPARHGVHGHFADHDLNARRGMPNWLDTRATTYTRLLQQGGYRIGHYGKWHLGHGDGAPEPFAYGIDECRINTGNGPYLGFLTNDVGPLRASSSELIVDETIGFIDRNKDQPFLANVWLNDTHATLDPDEKQLEPYLSQIPMGLKGKHAGASAIYFAAVTNADRHVGRLLDHLDATGLADNTIVIFSADNGPEDIAIRNSAHSGVGSPGPFRGRKRSLYEGGIRTPFILRWPAGGTPAGTVNNDSPVSTVDLLPTFCKAAGCDIPSDYAPDGESMLDVFAGSNRGRKTSLKWEWRFRIVGHVINRSPILAVREGNWKLLVNPDDSRSELFNIPADPMELNNVAESNPQVVEQLKNQVTAWQQELPEGPFDQDAGSNAYPWPK
jgi:N-acetylgalactosamine-6-sulfatase